MGSGPRLAPLVGGLMRNRGSAWRHIRAAIIERDGGACLRCAERDRLQVHHRNRDPRDNRPENLQTLCRYCHIKAHRRRHPVGPRAGAWDELARLRIGV